MTSTDIFVEVFSLGFGHSKLSELVPRDFIIYINTAIVESNG
jgi:hypothetical protein